jgi:RimJ/RimL family protein N-acetyltransferase
MLVVDTALATPRLLLRPFREGDADDLYAYRSRPDVVRHLYFDTSTYDEVCGVVERRSTMNRLGTEGDVLVLAVEEQATGRLVGDVSLTWTSAAHRQGELGFVFHPDVHGRGYAREAATAVLDLAFDRAGLHRVYGRADARNEPSARLMQRLGMRLEAHLRENEIFKGEWGDEVVYAVLAREWAGRREGAAPVGDDAARGVTRAR